MESNNSPPRGATLEGDQAKRDSNPRVLHPKGKLDSATHAEIANIIKPHDVWFRRRDDIVTVEQVASGFVYADDNDEKFKLTNLTAGFDTLTALRARSMLEKFMTPGILRKVEAEGEETKYVFKPKSFTGAFCGGMVESPFLRENLSMINRILTVPLPFRVNDRLVYPREGYDSRFGTYLLPDAPKIRIMPLEEAKKHLEWVYREFCFTEDGKGYSQSRVNAVARLLTPFARAIMGWTTRVPLWYYFANRPRAGKDYCAGVPLIIYEGFAFEDQPIGDNSEETGKRLLSAELAGRRFMHFANCVGHLRDPNLMRVITGPTHGGRILGSLTDAQLPNEMEYSLSANMGHSLADDYFPRVSNIEFAFFTENPNDRKFETRFLHRDVLENRPLFLSAIASCFDHWAREKFPNGLTSSLSYPAYSDVVGGVMLACEIGDPCLPFVSKFNEAGAGVDKRHLAMRALYLACFEREPEKLISKQRIFEIIDHEASGGNDALSYWGRLIDHLGSNGADTEELRINRQRVAQALRKYELREMIFSDGSDRFALQLQIDRSQKATFRQEFTFHKL